MASNFDREIFTESFVEPLKTLGIFFNSESEMNTFMEKVLFQLNRETENDEEDTDVAISIYEFIVQLDPDFPEIKRKALQNRESFYGKETFRKYQKFSQNCIYDFYENKRTYGIRRSKNLFETLYGLSTPGGDKLPVDLIVNIINYETKYKWSPALLS